MKQEYPTWIYPDGDVSRGFILNVFEQDGALMESKTYQDGTVATGPAPLPNLSPAEQSTALVLPVLTAPPKNKGGRPRKST